RGESQASVARTLGATRASTVASPLCSSASRGSTSRRPARAHGASISCEGDHHGRSKLRRRILGTVSRRLHFQDCGHARRGGERLVETEAPVNEFHESTTTAGVPPSTRAGSTFPYPRPGHRVGARAL